MYFYSTKLLFIGTKSVVCAPIFVQRGDKNGKNDNQYTITSTKIIIHLQLETRIDNTTGEITYRCRYQILKDKYTRTNKYTERFSRSDDAIDRGKELMRGILDNTEIIDYTDFTVEQLLNERETKVRKISLKEHAASYKRNKVNEIISQPSH